MNIAFVNNQLQLGGAETVLQQLREGVARAGHSHRLYVAHGKTYPPDVIPLYPRLLSRLSHTRLHSLVEDTFPRAKWTDHSFRKLAGNGADLIHLHNFHGDYATLESLAHVARCQRLVWTFHAFWGITGGCDHPQDCTRYQQACGQCPQLGHWPVGAADCTADQLKRKQKLLGGLRLHVVAPSLHLAERVRQSQIGKRWHLHHIPNGVAPDEFTFARKHDPQFRASLGLHPGVPAILVVNRNFQDPQKGFALVQEALATVNPASAQVILAGQNSDWAAARLSPGLARLDLGYVAARADLARWFEAADIFLFASPAENFPCVILEAMSAKCCVVATPTSGVIEQIEHGVSGLLASDMYGGSLGRALRDGLASPEKRRLCGEQARRTVETSFTEERMVSRHLALYAEILGIGEPVTLAKLVA